MREDLAPPIAKETASDPTLRLTTNTDPVAPNLDRASLISSQQANETLQSFREEAYLRKEEIQERNTYLLTMMDWFTWYPEVIPVRSASSKNAEQDLNFFCCFGFPAFFQSDHGSHFMPKEFQDKMVSNCATYITSTLYHPESQGDQLETIGYSPFELQYAHSTWGPLDVLYEVWEDPKKTAWVKELPNIQAKLKAAWDIAQVSDAVSQNRTKLRMDKRAREFSFEVHWGQIPLDTNFTRPHEILEKKGWLNYLVNCRK
ncbi:uncharacterized protein [Macrobrachium rosenbergii]|uniref:uncharacterized protein n=1 Tax=Macrobrachium rosenbergii TaxID=79674 RepID=UPI0034D5DD3C